MDRVYQPFGEEECALRDEERVARVQPIFRASAAGAAIMGVLALFGMLSSMTPSVPPSSLHLATPSVLAAEEDTRVFDESGRYIMRAFDRVKPMASFLPGVGGLWGVPMWTFYVNRGQGLATFGVKSKDGGILLFQTAEKAYQVTPFVGFRTLLKGKRASGKTFEAQPFFPQSDADETTTARRDMFIGNNEMEIEEADPVSGVRTNVVYFTAPNEAFPALVRRVTYTNEGDDAVELEVVDGLARLEPVGTSLFMLNAMGRTLEGWMHVYNFETDHTAPFFHLVTAPADTADVTMIKDGYFAAAFLDDEMLPMICDQQLLFGTDTTLAVPRRFFSSAKRPGGAPLAELLKAPQSTTSRTPSAFAAATISLKPGESKTISIVYGYASDIDSYLSTVLPKLKADEYFSLKREEAQSLGKNLTERVAMSSGVPVMDNYIKQNYLDNLLRGGMPVPIGNPDQPKIYHAYSRIHGDLERDYNNFVLEPSYWSQGPGNFRDVNQNRRCDVLQLPSVKDFNVRQFFSYIQSDGYNQLTVATAFFKIHDVWRVNEVVEQLLAPGDMQQKLKEKLLAPFRPGQLFTDLNNAGVTFKLPLDKVLEIVTRYAEQVPAGQYSQNGFWTDHFTYHLDLVWNFLAVFPDLKEWLLYDSNTLPFFLSPGRVANRTEKNMLVAEPSTVRQYDAVRDSGAKQQQLQIIYGDPNFVGDWGGGGTWQLTASGTTMKVSPLAKLVVLAANKFCILDPLGMGIEMEAGKPGWNDAMNGLPALFGSEMPSAYELHEIVDFVGVAIDEAARAVSLPEEVAALLDAIDAQLRAVLGGSTSDFTYWDKVHDALEAYRTKTEATFTGTMVSRSAKEMGKATGVFGRMLARMDVGIARALSYSTDPHKKVSPTYFRFNVKSFKLVGVSGRGLPTVQVTEFDEGQPLPLFLEGPTRHLKTLKRASQADKQAVYDAVAASTLHDNELGMYKISESLKGQPLEIGRMMAFDSGWLENESIWLHMSYKWYLELLRAGLYAQFFEEIRKGVVCFLDTKVFGRSPLEATSFIVSSAFPDKALHGSGFLARLSGTTAEFLSMWNHMMAGAAPFSLNADGKLQLALRPIVADWMWRDDGTINFKFLGNIDVTYVLHSKKNSWEATVQSYVLHAADGDLKIDGEVIPMPAAEQVRNMKYSAITVFLS
ncbi:hypothetical protein AB1Y20_020885 [Prymnesium parvum]|uniref:Uncharacterized protein n=1 Tax=Prymnesium parvum TaxID=97485 RepID=A0AB34JUU1_PRYPA